MNTLTAFDPGLTTGWITVDLDDLHVVGRGQFTDWQETVPELIHESYTDHVAYESFILRRGAYTSDQISPVYVIGAIETWAAHEGAVVWSYPPSSTKAVTDEVLERLGWLVRPKTPNRHTNDAARVAVLACKEIIGTPFTERAWPK